MARAEITRISRLSLRNVKLMWSSRPISVGQRMKPALPITVLLIFNDQQGIVEKDLFGFRLAHIVFIDTFAAVALIPVKPFNLEKVKHLSILP